MSGVIPTSVASSPITVYTGPLQTIVSTVLSLSLPLSPTPTIPPDSILPYTLSGSLPRRSDVASGLFPPFASLLFPFAASSSTVESSLSSSATNVASNPPIQAQATNASPTNSTASSSAMLPSYLTSPDKRATIIGLVAGSALFLIILISASLILWRQHKRDDANSLPSSEANGQAGLDYPRTNQNDKEGEIGDFSNHGLDDSDISMHSYNPPIAEEVWNMNYQMSPIRNVPPVR